MAFKKCYTDFPEKYLYEDRFDILKRVLFILLKDCLGEDVPIDVFKRQDGRIYLSINMDRDEVPDSGLINPINKYIKCISFRDYQLTKTDMIKELEDCNMEFECIEKKEKNKYTGEDYIKYEIWASPSDDYKITKIFTELYKESYNKKD